MLSDPVDVSPPHFHTGKCPVCDVRVSGQDYEVGVFARFLQSLPFKDDGHILRFPFLDHNVVADHSAADMIICYRTGFKVFLFFIAEPFYDVGYIVKAGIPSDVIIIAVDSALLMPAGLWTGRGWFNARVATLPYTKGSSGTSSVPPWAFSFLR